MVTVGSDPFGGHGIRVAYAITQDWVLAELAMASVWTELGHDRTASRVEILGAVCQRAGGLAMGRGDEPVASDPAAVYRIAEPMVRDALALAIAGECTGSEIAAVLGVERAEVYRCLGAGLRLVAGIIEGVSGVSDQCDAPYGESDADDHHQCGGDERGESGPSGRDAAGAAWL